jgi:uncharacterized membrane protein (UPF0127 family)
MAKKQNRKNEHKQTQTKKKIGKPQIIIGIIAVIIIGIFIYKNFFENNEVEGEYYTFTKDGELTFTDSTGTLKAKIDLEIADTEYKRELGLMNRKELGENQGMLFIFPKPAQLSFWMRNTLISLDMIFVNEQKTIVTIHKYTKILSDQSYTATQPAMYVVEVSAGFCDKHNIEVGDKIDWIGTKKTLQ